MTKTMSITKQEVLDNLEQVKSYIQEAETKKEEKAVGITIMSRFGGVKVTSTKTTFKDAVVENKADLRDAELNCSKFYGRSGTIKIMKKDLPGFLGALGFKLED